MVIESLHHCQIKKGLVIHAWCLMSNHLHLIISKKGKMQLEGILRDFKKFTSGTILKAIKDEPTESRKNWMIWIFKQAGKTNPNNRNFQFWQQDNHPEELITNEFIDQKLDYIHNNPVFAGLVDEPQHYRYSSARDYAGGKGLLDVVLIE
jgi:REP element-mobilizing transposase RayT